MHPKALLQRYQLEPKQSLGQNFLFDDGILARIAATADLNPDDHILEIGPGLGGLTRHLAKTAVRVVAVELDNRLLPVLQNELAYFKNVDIIHGDILEQNPADLFDSPYKVIANVPYYITGAVLRHLLTAVHKPTLMVLTVQKEVAERLTAIPSHMSLLAVSVQFYGRVQISHLIKAGAFWPRPEVDSAVIRLDLYEEPLLPPAEEEAFFQLVKAGFSQKRKQLHKNLRSLGWTREVVETVLERAGVDGQRRAETLTIGEWTAVYQAYAKR
jgi:16S rRNA (adenine1518-N6/adenine1519-N6)-dimethyltransferase